MRWADEEGFRKSKVYSSKADAEFKLKEEELKVEQIKRGLRARELKSISDSLIKSEPFKSQ